jgi:hypothetical protein
MMELTNPLTPINVNTLSMSECIVLADCETTLAAGCKHFMAVGNALLTIQQGKLHRDTHTTFAIYLKERWGISRPTGYQYIQSAKTVGNLSAIADILPTNEAQTRPLSRLKPDDQRAAWKQVLSVSDNKPTALFVEQVVEEFTGMAPTRRNKGQMAATPITLNSTEGTPEEEAADYHTLWQAEKERADNLQNQVRALEAEVARLLPGVEDMEAEVVDIASRTAETQAGADTKISDGEDATCPVCSGPNWSQCPCDSDTVNGLLLGQGRIAA